MAKKEFPPLPKALKKAGPVKIPHKFVPMFWEDHVGASLVVKEIKHRVARLQEEAGADSYQKQMLCQIAVFIQIQLESMGVQSVLTGELERGIYTQMANSLSGLLSKLGLKRHEEEMGGVNAYLAEKAKAKEAKA